jgi:hypothetical protein
LFSTLHRGDRAKQKTRRVSSRRSFAIDPITNIHYSLAMLKMLITSVLLAIADPILAACDKLMPLADAVGNVQGYVIPQDVIALSGGSSGTTHIVLNNGATIDVPISVTSVYQQLSQNCPTISSQ